MKNGVILITLLTLYVTHTTPADACSGIRSETRLPADGDSEVPVNTRVFVGGFGPGGVGPYEDPDWIPTLRGPDGLVAVDVEHGGDGRAAWALLTPKTSLTANTTYTVEGSFLAASTFTTGAEPDTTPPEPLAPFKLTANNPDRCEPLSTCGWSSTLVIDRDIRSDASAVIRVFVRKVGDDAPELVGVIPESTSGWGLGSATAANNSRAFPLTPGSSASGSSPEDWFDQEWCIRLVAEDLAGNVTAMADAPETCAILLDGRPIDCSEEAPGDSDVAPATASSASGCATTRGSTPWAISLILLGLLAAHSRRHHSAGNVVA
ncbi:MAG: hypothetical protein IV100_24685 [Myxococcales bacterium]|nr:hypothetical protein [Myxococcales bacterium]